LPRRHSGACAKAGYKPPFVTQLKGVEAVELMRAMRPVLGPDRQRQIDDVVRDWMPRRRRSHGTLNRFVPLDPFIFAAEDDRALSWLAGLLEGEGTFTVTCDANRRCYPVVSVHMSDAAVIFRAAPVLEADAVSMREPEQPAWRPTYVAKVGGARAADWVNPPGSCVVAGCERPTRARGVCHTHYMMWSRDRAKGRDARIVPLR